MAVASDLAAKGSVKDISINQSINNIRVHHATQALGHNMVQSSI